jgi:hypothetical protein
MCERELVVIRRTGAVGVGPRVQPCLDWLAGTELKSQRSTFKLTHNPHRSATTQLSLGKITPISVRFRASESQFSSRLRPKFRHIQSEQPRCEQEPDQAKCMENQNGMCLAHRERQMLGIPLIRNWSIPPDFSDGGTTKGR